MILSDFLGKLNQDIINYYCMPNQVNQLMEECGELISASNHYLRSCGSDRRSRFLAEENLKAEMVDVLVVLDQILRRMAVTPEVLNFMAEQKVNRQLARIKNGGK